jgi:pyrroloquinoline quinone (PQQ) biosynthesis protein C
MKDFVIVFFYKDYPATYGTIHIRADSEDAARERIKHMITDRDGQIPGNWDRWTITGQK